METGVAEGDELTEARPWLPIPPCRDDRPRSVPSQAPGQSHRNRTQPPPFSEAYRDRCRKASYNVPLETYPGAPVLCIVHLLPMAGAASWTLRLALPPFACHCLHTDLNSFGAAYRSNVPFDLQHRSVSSDLKCYENCVTVTGGWITSNNTNCLGCSVETTLANFLHGFLIHFLPF